MTQTAAAETPPGSIVVGHDGSEWSEGALDWAVDQATCESRPLTIVHALAPMDAQSVAPYAAAGLEVVRLVEDARAAAQAMLAAATARALAREPGVDVHHLLVIADPRTVLLDLSERAAMVVVGSRGRGPVASLLLGSVSVSVARHASCPVVVRRSREPVTPVLRVVVGVDGTSDSLPAVEFAFRVASLRRSTLAVLHCARPSSPVAAAPDAPPPPDLSDERALVAESLAGMAEQFPDVEVTVHVASGAAAHELVDASGEYDLVVVGHHRVGHLRELIDDSVAAAVLEHASGVVAVVPSGLAERG